ncbi:uncharacterized protein LOC130589635 [Beta vulgaris subsp. vulgaris]|uniref:uncharacterized protein LOC130589635 n=1 Tax=Beta vulgaris subsp. vulgaris TaxID=3555 RepID=UPI00254761C6|nr:uncharacterized protein LOC130589635 [Beta vulgaris subsp. vulgaris]
MVAGLTEAYSSVGTLLRQSDPLPPFYQARSMLVLEEADLSKKTTIGGSSTALVAGYGDGSITDSSTNRNSNANKNKNNSRTHNNKHRNSGGQRGSQTGGTAGGRGGRQPGGGGRGTGNQQQQFGRGTQQQQWAQHPPWMMWPWAYPPCPYPTSSWARPTYAPRSAVAAPGQQHYGVLGPRPQAYSTDTQTTDIEAAMYTMGINPPDPNWYMDTGATSHMTSSQGNMSSYFNLSKPNGIIVGNGNSIPIHGYG